MKSASFLLDNPAWAALTTAQAVFATGTERAKRYSPAVLPFAACAADGSMHELEVFIATGESFFIIGDLPVLPDGWVIDLELPCAQMLLQKMRPVVPLPAVAAAGVVQLGPADADEMLALITVVQPGYYLRDTHLLGNYFGIKENGRLVAMAGERMRLTGYTELSAICTLPEYTGRGYAQQLMRHLCSGHAAAGIISFLHVALANQRAIRLYEHMGFTQRRVIVFYRIKKRLN